MMQYSINREAFNAVIACSGIEDMRFYLNSFFVDTTNSTLVATNGHVLAKVPLERLNRPGDPCNPETHGDLQGFLFDRLAKPLPPDKGDVVIIDCEQGKLRFPRGKREPRELQLERIDGVFPNYLLVIAKPGGSVTSVPGVGFNLEYLAKPAKWAGYNRANVYLEFREEGYPMFVTYGEQNLIGVEITLAPCRR